MRASIRSSGARPKSGLGTSPPSFASYSRFILADAPGGADLITKDEAVMTRGKQVFAASCAGCHSSKQPPSGVDPQSAEGKAWFASEVMKPDFLENNFLSNERRYPLDANQDELRARLRHQRQGRPCLG